MRVCLKWKVSPKPCSLQGIVLLGKGKRLNVDTCESQESSEAVQSKRPYPVYQKIWSFVPLPDLMLLSSIHPARKQKWRSLGSSTPLERQAEQIDHFSFFFGRNWLVWPHFFFLQLVARGGRRAWSTAVSILGHIVDIDYEWLNLRSTSDRSSFHSYICWQGPWEMVRWCHHEDGGPSEEWIPRRSEC